MTSATRHPDEPGAAPVVPEPAHHFRSLRHQHDAATLGMWLFLATEVLLFSGLFCLYAVLRFKQPELFRYGSAFLDTGWGAINTAVLIVSSLTMAVAVRCAQCGNRRQTVLFLSLTMLCGVDFMGVKFIEYRHKVHEHLVWGTGFYASSAAATPAFGGAATGGQVDATVPLEPGDAEAGAAHYARSCAACHGADGAGMAGFGRPLTTSAFVAELDDEALTRFLVVGRRADDPRNTTGMAMLPRAGDPRLSDQDLMDIAAHVRVLQAEAKTIGGAAGDATVPAPAPELVRSAVPSAAPAPRGLAGASAQGELHAGAPTRASRPANAHLFFGVYFLMTGLHGIHVLIGMLVIGWLIVRAQRGDFSRHYFTPVDLGGLYWHVIDLIWIFLFPLLYLID